MRGHRDLWIVTGLALLCALLAPLLPIDVLSLLFALPLALFLPGYALTAAIFARREIGRAQVWVLSAGLSLAVLALGALLLNYVPSGIGPVSWAVLLLLVVLNGCRVAALRRPGPTGDNRARPWPQLRFTAAGAGLLLGALACTTVALAITFDTHSAPHADGYTAMWLLPPTPSDAPAGGARIGVESEQQSRTAYRLQIRIGGRAEEIVRSFSLNPGETRVLKLQPRVPSAAPIKAKLFLQSEPGDVYRRVSGWLAKPQSSP
jgi:Protein of unknown function (DUF1616)